MYTLILSSKCTNNFLHHYINFNKNCHLRSIKDVAKGVPNETKNINKKYTHSVLLPRTQFPLHVKGKLRVTMDDELLKKCGFLELYNWQRKHLLEPEFILHDGPPYANGVPHMGHAINKILKDITIRSKVIKGQRVHYVPGWDCHGLPIELKAIGKSGIENITQDPLNIRHTARKYAENAIKEQREVFSSWGIMADWTKSGCYFTNNISYIKNQLHQFINLYEKGLIFRDFKPVYWSPISRTALAESELEYNEQHESKCATVRLRVSDLPPKLMQFTNKTLYALTWTTTPWTLVANQALAFSPNSNYSITEDSQGNLYIIDELLVKNIESKIGQLKSLTTINGNEFIGTKYLHPITKKSLPFLPGEHVTRTLGTGLVHTAPAHGPEDFVFALEHNIPIVCLVDEEGRYTELAGSNFSGLKVLTEGTEKVLKYIGEDILYVESIKHSYPYDWRAKEPIIIRASHQWFININAIKQKALDDVASIQIFPENNRSVFQNNLLAQIKQRPYWCISRQRYWGTPIPVLYYKDTGKLFTNRKVVERMCELVEKQGPDWWWELSIEKLVGQDILQEFNIRSSDLIKGEDIMDIWFDSGISWSKILPQGKADLYLEGIDQFNGWFQSSLLTSIALQGCAPYSALFVHGFAVDENSQKMSKSQGNVINPDEITKGGNNLAKNPVYGVDTLRWWVASHGCQHQQVPVTKEIIRGSNECVQKLRSILRFLLGSLYPYNTDINVEPKYMHLDNNMLHRLYHYNQQIQHFYDNYQYHHVCKIVLNFIANDISSIYCHLTKDRLYCDPVSSPKRVAVVKVMKEILNVLNRSIAPIVPHLAEEVWLHHPENNEHTPLHHTKFSVPEDWNQPDTTKYIETALQLRSNVHKLSTKNTWELMATVEATTNDYNLFSILQTEERSETSELCEILQVSKVTLIKNDALSETQVHLNPIEAALCKRCRRHPEIQSDLCNRCSNVFNTSVSATAFN